MLLSDYCVECCFQIRCWHCTLSIYHQGASDVMLLIESVLLWMWMSICVALSACCGNVMHYWVANGISSKWLSGSNNSCFVDIQLYIFFVLYSKSFSNNLINNFDTFITRNCGMVKYEINIQIPISDTFWYERLYYN